MTQLTGCLSEQEKEYYCRMRLKYKTGEEQPWHYLRDRKELLNELDANEELDSLGTFELELL